MIFKFAFQLYLQVQSLYLKQAVKTARRSFRRELRQTLPERSNRDAGAAADAETLTKYKSFEKR